MNVHKNPAFLVCDWNGSIIPIRYAKASAAVQRGVNSKWSTIKVRSVSVSSIPVKRSKFYNSLQTRCIAQSIPSEDPIILLNPFVALH
ncbi:hypothetical protein FXE19_02965 [Vibrio cholerae]|nr:hypothetical protein [Vibrio cholerae]TYA95319.1 hypothetical protein FXE19_02965 [Vibrio cholerae]